MIEFRKNLLDQTMETATGILLDPATPKRPHEVLTALQKCLDAYEALVVATSNSNRGFEFTDLLGGEAKRRDQAKHVISLLHIRFGDTAG